MYQTVGGFNYQNYLLMGISQKDKVQNQQKIQWLQLHFSAVLWLCISYYSKALPPHTTVLRGRERVDPINPQTSEKMSFLEEPRKPLLGSQCSGMSLISISQPKLVYRKTPIYSLKDSVKAHEIILTALDQSELPMCWGSTPHAHSHRWWAELKQT